MHGVTCVKKRAEVAVDDTLEHKNRRIIAGVQVSQIWRKYRSSFCLFLHSVFSCQKKQIIFSVIAGSTNCYGQPVG